ncbi:ATP-binding protein [Saccharomonospora sp. NPDC006951]
MRCRELEEWRGPAGAGPFELTVPAEFRNLATLRALARHLAAHEGFGPDETADVTIAVDEACTCLIRRSTPGAMLNCRYSVTFGTLRVAISTTTTHGGLPQHDTFGWRVLGVVTDTLSAWRCETGLYQPARQLVHIDFTKQFAPHPRG